VVRVTVEDNGIGIPQKAERSQHYGLAIMQERANSLRGDLRIDRLPQGGTRVCLRFRPKTDQQNNFSAQAETAT
jgi:two-component system nitrate/nitrite sensor histidine kinase NarX